MKFSKFLKILYKNKNDEPKCDQEEFVVKMFNSTGMVFSYSEGYGKNLLSGKKPLSKDIRDAVLEKWDGDGLCKFFFEIENPDRINDFFKAFDIADDIDKYFNVLCVSLTLQFYKYMDTGNDTGIDIPITYEHILDDVQGKTELDNNINALLETKKFINSALESISNVEDKHDLLKNSSLFESFFSSIKSAHYSFFKKVDYKMREIYRAFCKGCYSKDRPKDRFLYEVSKQTTDSIDLIKKINYISYSDMISEDKTESIELSIFEENESEKRIEALNKLSTKTSDIIYFSEFISFQIKGSDDNLLYNYLYILLKTIKTFEYMTEEIGSNDKIEYMDKLIKDKYSKLNISMIQFINDGEYHNNSNHIEYANTIDPFFSLDDGTLELTGSHLMRPNEYRFNNAKTIYNKMVEAFYINAFFMKNKESADGMMLEIYTFNPDDSYREYLVPPTCKAKIYRFVRNITRKMICEKSTSFFVIGISQMANIENTSEVKDVLLGFCYEKNKCSSILLPFDEIKKGNTKNIIKGNYINPMFLPMVAVASANQKKRPNS